MRFRLQSGVGSDIAPDHWASCDHITRQVSICRQRHPRAAVASVLPIFGPER